MTKEHAKKLIEMLRDQMEISSPPIARKLDDVEIADLRDEMKKSSAFMKQQLADLRPKK